MQKYIATSTKTTQQQIVMFLNFVRFIFVYLRSLYHLRRLNISKFIDCLMVLDVLKPSLGYISSNMSFYSVFHSQKYTFLVSISVNAEKLICFDDAMVS